MAALVQVDGLCMLFPILLGSASRRHTADSALAISLSEPTSVPQHMCPCPLYGQVLPNEGFGDPRKSQRGKASTQSCTGATWSV